jgi:hypothetical protein
MRIFLSSLKANDGEPVSRGRIGRNPDSAHNILICIKTCLIFNFTRIYSICVSLAKVVTRYDAARLVGSGCCR